MTSKLEAAARELAKKMWSRDDSMPEYPTVDEIAAAMVDLARKFALKALLQFVPDDGSSVEFHDCLPGERDFLYECAIKAAEDE